jgi:hypothetical protein
LRTVRRLAFCALWLISATSCDNGSTDPARPPAALQIVSGNEQEAVVGTELPEALTVRVIDDLGQPVAGQLVNFRVTSGGGSVFAGASITNAQGIARDRWTLGTSIGVVQQVEARAVDAATGDPIVFGTFTATTIAGPLATLTVVAGSNQSIIAGGTLPDSLLLRAFDEYGNPVAGASVQWSVPAGHGTLSTATSVTSDSGYASTKWTLGTTRGDYQATATAGEKAAVFSAHVGSSAPTRLVVTAGDNQQGEVGTALSVAPQVRLEDSYGNPVEGWGITFSPTSGSGSIQTTQLATGPDGLASATWTLGIRPGSQILRVIASSTVQLTLQATATVGPPASITKYAGDGQVATAGSAVETPPSVIVKDRFANVIAGASVQFTAVSSFDAVTGSPALTNAQGIATVGSWTLGVNPGSHNLNAAVGDLPPVQFIATAETSSPITVTFETPTTNQVVSDTILVSVRTSSPSPITQVRARVGTAEWPLTFSSGSWRGTVVLTEPGFGPFLLFVSATAQDGTVREVSRSIIRDRKPTLVINAPLDFSVARPTLQVSATCMDDDPAGCAFMEARGGGGVVVLTGTSQLEGTVSQAAYNGSLVAFSISARDSRGQVTTQVLNIFVEGSTSLTELATLPGQVFDLQGQRALYSRRGVNQLPLTSIRRLDTQAEDSVQLASRMGELTSLGAIFITGTGSASRIGELRNGVSSFVTPEMRVDTLLAAGDYALFYQFDSALTRYTVSTSSSTIINDRVRDADLNESGEVVFGPARTPPSPGIYRYRNGSLEIIALSDANGSYNHPQTDGQNVIYTRQTGTPAFQILLRTPAETIELTTLLSPPQFYYPDRKYYRLSGGWAAYLAYTSIGYRLTRRSPAGAYMELSESVTAYGSYGTAFGLNALSPNGDVVYTTGDGRRFLWRAGASAAVQIGSAVPAKVIWRDGRFVFLIGRSILTVTP